MTTATVLSGMGDLGPGDAVGAAVGVAAGGAGLNGHERVLLIEDGNGGDGETPDVNG